MVQKSGGDRVSLPSWAVTVIVSVLASAVVFIYHTGATIKELTLEIAYTRAALSQMQPALDKIPPLETRVAVLEATHGSSHPQQPPK